MKAEYSSITGAHRRWALFFIAAIFASLLMADCTAGLGTMTPVPPSEQPSNPTPVPTSEQPASPTPVPARESAEIVRVGCSAPPLEEPSVHSLRVAASGTAHLNVGSRLFVYFNYEGQDHSFDQFSDAPLQRSNEPLNWTGTLSQEVEDDLPPELRITAKVSSLAPGQRLSDGLVELSRMEFTCKVPPKENPRVTVDLVDCVVVERQGDRKAYQITATGTVFGPKGAEAILTLGTDVDGLFELASVQARWQSVGTGGMRREEGNPAFTSWNTTIRTALLPASGVRSAVGTAALVVQEQRLGSGARTTRPCESQPTDTPTPTATPTRTPTPTATPKLEATIDPARDVTGTWKGGINLVPTTDQTGCSQWSGPLVLDLKQTAGLVAGSAQITFSKLRDVETGAECGGGGLEPFEADLAGKVSSSAIEFYLDPNAFATFTGSFTSDLMGGDIAWESVDGAMFLGCFQVGRTSLGALSDCHNKFVATPTPIPPTPTATPTPTPRPTAIPITTTVTSLSCTAVSSRDVFESANNRTVTYVTWQIDAAGTADGPENRRILINNPLDSWTLNSGSWSANDGVSTGGRGRTPGIIRQPGQPQSTKWTLSGKYSPSGYYSTTKPFAGEAAERPFTIKVSTDWGGGSLEATCRK